MMMILLLILVVLAAASAAPFLIANATDVVQINRAVDARRRRGRA